MKKTFALPLSLAVLLTLAATAGYAADPAKSAPSALDQMFATKVTQGNLAEIQAGTLAKSRTQSPAVKNIAKTLVDDHTKANMDLAKITRDEKITVPKAPYAEQKEMAAKLAKLSGKKFDDAFLEPQLKDHEATIALFKKEMSEGQDAKLKTFAATYLPAIENHADMLKNAMKPQ